MRNFVIEDWLDIPESIKSKIMNWDYNEVYKKILRLTYTLSKLFIGKIV